MTNSDTRVDGCVFCSIVAGETEAEVVLTEESLVAFLDQRPVFKGHVLLVPRDHVDTLVDLPAELRDGFLEAAQRLAAAVVAGLGAQGSFVAMTAANPPAALGGSPDQVLVAGRSTGVLSAL